MTRTGFVWVILAFTVYGLVHSSLASLRAKALAERWFGSAARRWYRLFFNFQAAATFLPILALVGLLPDARIYAIPVPWVLATAALQAACAVGLLVGVIQTGARHFLGLRQLSGQDLSDHPAALAVKGFYRWVRHPLYTFGLVFIWLTPVMTWNLLAFNLGATAYILIGILFEERKLLLAFGEQYAAYRRQTPMLVPGLRFNRKQ